MMPGPMVQHPLSQVVPAADGIYLVIIGFLAAILLCSCVMSLTLWLKQMRTDKYKLADNRHDFLRFRAQSWYCWDSGDVQAQLAFHIPGMNWLTDKLNFALLMSPAGPTESGSEETEV